MDCRALPDFQEAIPPLLFDGIFSYLSPAFLWAICRRVCKSWKQNIENGSAFYESILSNAVLYFYVHKTPTFTQESTDILQAFGCTGYDMDRGTVKFTSLIKEEPLTLVDDTICYYRNVPNVHKNIRIGMIRNSIFPRSRSGGGKRLDPIVHSKSHLPMGKLRVFTGPGGEPNRVYDGGLVLRTPGQVEEFRSKTDILKGTERLYDCHASGKFPVEVNFDRPNVELEIAYGIYIFKCLYKTTLEQSWMTKGLEPGKSYYERHRTLLVREIEVSVRDLCRWTCSCKTPCDFDTLTSWTCSTQFPPWNKKGSRLFPELLNFGKFPPVLQPYDPPAYRDLFPRWIEEERQQNKEYDATTPPCSQCQKWLPSMRCSEKLCRRCCLTVHCKMHRNCCECRQGEMEKIEYKTGGVEKPKPAQRDCLKHYYNGIECKNRDKATGLLNDLHRLGHPIDGPQATDDCQETKETKKTKKAIAGLLRKLHGMGMEKPHRLLYAIPGRATEEKKEPKIGRRRL